MKNRFKILLLVALFGNPFIKLVAQDKEWGPFDRLLVTQYFLNAVYPGLAHYEGALILRTIEFHTITGQGNVVDLVPCHPGSGVVYHPDSERTQEPPPHCGDGRYLAKTLDFLSMDIKFGVKYPIREFGALGSFAHSKSEPVDKQIAAHPEWDDRQRLEAVRHADPQFGPDKKAEFLKSLPIDAISKFTGCHLRLDSAEFLTYRQEGEAHASWGHAEWRISGSRQRETSDQEESCTARFEPFDGRLIYLGNL